MTEANSKKVVLRSQIAAAIADYAWLVGVYSILGSVLFPSSRWGGLTHLGIPLVAYPFYAFLTARYLGATPSQLLLGLRIRSRVGRRPDRFYDWLFQSRLELAIRPRPFPLRLLFVIASMVFAIGGCTLLWMRDPTVRPFAERRIELFAPDAAEARAWDTIPFYYATGAFPRPNHPLFRSVQTGEGLEYSLPYERGPPTRFLGKVVAHWRKLDSRVILSGPVTAASPSTPEQLRACMGSWFGCVSARRKIWKASISPYFDDRKIVANEWFEVDNGFLTAEERPRGIYLRSRAEKGRFREAYFFVGPKMAVQAFILDRPEREEGEAASRLLAQVVGSARISGDLAAPRAFINPKIAAIRLGPKSSLADLVAAEALLLAKVSIEPKEGESFYHLAGLAITLFRAAKKEGRIELAATSKTVVTNALHYLRDVDPKSPRIPEMERFDAEVEAD